MPDFQVILPEGNIATLQDFEVAAPVEGNSFESILSFIESSSKDLAVVIFSVKSSTGQKRGCTATLVKVDGGIYKLRSVQQS